MYSSLRTFLSVAAILLLTSVFLVAGTIDLGNLLEYENQTVPVYITRDNTGNNAIQNITATLGRVLFYDKNLSSDNTVNCATCHQQAVAFSDLDVVSEGVNGVTGRHSMRLINSRFSDEVRFFWDERAATLEEQTTQPIQDHAEMGFSGTNGDPDFNDLIVKMQGTPYYRTLFAEAFGDDSISEARMQLALAQFIRSIQSFDSKFDAGIAQVNGDINADFPNFSDLENEGKTLFHQDAVFDPIGVRVGGGLGCAQCHQGPEFSIHPQRGNIGLITVANDPNAIDLTVTRSPTMRDLFSPSGTLNGPMMHDGSFTTFDEVIDHYDDITFDPTVNPDLATQLRGGPQGQGQKLMMTQRERDALTAYARTLSGTDVYTNELWSDPFEADGSLIVMGVLGDVDRNGTVNFSDIGPFIATLQAGIFLDEADCNQDGFVNFGDIPAFIGILQGS